MLQVARAFAANRHADIVTGVAECATAQERDFVGVVAGNVEASFDSGGKCEGSNFLDAVIEQ